MSAPPSSVALIMTTYNNGQFIAEAVQSVIDQTHQDWELVIWDDGSTDDTLEVLRKFDDPRIILLACHHQGRSQSLIQASEVLVGLPFTALVDADDILCPKVLEKTVAALMGRPDAGFAYTQYIDIDCAGHPLGLGAMCRHWYVAGLLAYGFYTQHFRLMRSRVFWDVGGFDPDFQTAMDYDLCVRMSEAAAVVQFIEPLYFKREHLGQISTRQSGQQSLDSQLVIRKMVERHGARRRSVA